MLDNSSLQAALVFKHVTNLTMSKVTVQHVKGFGVYWEALHGLASITNCAFLNNSGSENHLGGNAALVYSECEEYNDYSADIIIDETSFLNGRSKSHVAAGLVVTFKCPNVSVQIRNVIMTGNEAHHTGYKEDPRNIGGGNLAVAYYETSKNNTMEIRNSTFISGKAFLGGGMFVRYYNYCGNSFLVSDSKFTSNLAYEDGGAVCFSLNQSLSVDNSIPKSQVKFDSCIFQSNTVMSKKDAGIGMSIVHFDAMKSSVPLYHSIELYQCVFAHNTNIPAEDGGSSSGSASLRQHFGAVQIMDCTFDSNDVTALAAFRSKLFFSGNVRLHNNSGYEGGGIVLCEASYMILTHNTTLNIMLSSQAVEYLQSRAVSKIDHNVSTRNSMRQMRQFGS